jgi:hypothetical protein
VHPVFYATLFTETADFNCIFFTVSTFEFKMAVRASTLSPDVKFSESETSGATGATKERGERIHLSHRPSIRERSLYIIDD